MSFKIVINFKNTYKKTSTHIVINTCTYIHKLII